MTLTLDTVVLHQVRLPLVSPFTTSFGTEKEKAALLLEARTTVSVGGVTREVVGWGECVAMEEPLYSSEYIAGVQSVLVEHLLPRLFAAQRERPLTAETVGEALAPVIGHPMAKAALEMALLDAQLRAAGTSFADYLGVTAERVPSGVSVGIQDSIPELLTVVQDYLDQGYRRIKLKIKPGQDVEPTRAVRERFGDIPLQVDANAAYTLADAAVLRKLDAFDLLLIEQPLAEDDLRQHAMLARQLVTPICLDESVVSAARAADALALGAASIINIKPGRVGGYLEARRIHDLCRASGAAVWCGGMLETGLGRAANAALAGLPGFTLTGDISGSDRFYAVDLTPPVIMVDGYVEIRREPGLGDHPEPARLQEFGVGSQVVEAPPHDNSFMTNVRVGGRTLGLSNLDKPLYPDGWTKGEVIDYYARIADTMLPHVRDRALTRLRFPGGVPRASTAPHTGGTTPLAAGSFYEKNAPVGTPTWVRRQPVRTSEGVIDYVVADETATLVWLANLAALELHVPQWTIGSGRVGSDGVLDLPGEEPKEGEPLADRVVVDLDPGAGMDVLDSAHAALLVAQVLAGDGLVPVPQTSGSKGVQVYAAVAPCRARDAWAYVKGLNAAMAKARPDFFVASMSVEQRRGRIYVDHNQDLPARNTIAPYSLRGRERPSVATPVTWEELAGATRPEDLHFSPADVLDRVTEHGDLAADLLLDDRPPLP